MWSFISFLRLLPCLPVTSIPPFICPSITRYKMQFLHKMWPIQLTFHLIISCRIFFCSLTLCNTSSFLTWSFQLIFSILLQHHISKLSRCLLFLTYSKKFMNHVLCVLTCKISKSYEQKQNLVLIRMWGMLCWHSLAILCWENIHIYTFR